MKFFKLCSAISALVFYGLAIGMFALSFVDTKAVVLGKANITHWYTGFEIAFGQSKLESNNTLGTLFAFIFVAIGALAAIYAIVASFIRKKKRVSFNLKLLCASCSFVVCGVVPAVLLFLTLKTTDVTSAVLLGSSYKLGVGAILGGLFTLVGAGALGAAEIK